MIKNGRADVRRTSTHVRTKKVLYARTRTHIFKAPSAPECTKIAAPACVRVHTKGLDTMQFLFGTQ